MRATKPTSAVVVRVPLPARLARLRERGDWAASISVPPHVTVLFPFLPAVALVPPVRALLLEVARRFQPFDVCFNGVGRFPGVVYLRPDPTAPFSAMTEAVHRRFPDYPPYGGQFDAIVPHLTITELVGERVDEKVLEAVAAQAELDVPLNVRVSRLDVLVEGTDGRWHDRWRMPLGGG